MIHGAAETGYSTGSATYVSGRPDYPDAVDAWLRQDVGLRADRIVLDLGAGTGKFTKRLLNTQARVIAVEPVAAMRAALQAELPQITTLKGTAENIPLEDASVDAVICAQAFHWFATDAALAEIHRALKPNGTLGLIWNVRDETVPWVKALTVLMTPFEGDTPRHGSGEWRKVFPSPLFVPVSETGIPHSHDGPPEQVIVDRVMSVSFISALSGDQQKAVRDAVRALIKATPDLAGRATVSFPYRTDAYCWKKI